MNDYLNNPEMILKSAMDCKEYAEDNCNGCPYLIDEDYYGERKDECFEVIMGNTSDSDKAEMMVQLYLLGDTKQAE